MPTRNIVDLSGLDTQRAFIESRPPKPLPTSTLSTQRFSSRNSDGSENHTVVGVHVVIAKGQPNGLWEALNVDRASQKIDGHNPKVATRSLTICCDKLEIGGEFSVPEANVDIYARCLKWADDFACINTSPLPWTTAKAGDASGTTAGQHGAAGRHAGSLGIFVHETDPPSGPRPRLIAIGGRGQDPGTGLDGKNGDRMSQITTKEFKIRDSGVSTSRKTLTFDPPAVHIEYEWHWAASTVWGPAYYGDDRFPTSGTDALAPGNPGNGGNGGKLTTTLASLEKSFRNDSGNPGKKDERNYHGGSAGTPTLSAKYKVQLWENIFGTDDAGYTLKEKARNTTKPGNDALAKDRPSGSAGTRAEKADLVTSNAWLHPIGLQATLEYARDLFLAGARDDVSTLLEAYRDGLAKPQPKNPAWSDVPASQWTAAQIEVATMLQRLRAHLDYFGHPAGYTPILSLPGSIKLYEDETTRAMRMMLLTDWISDADRDVRERTAAVGEAITTVNEDSRQAAEQVAGAEGKVAQVQGLIPTLEHDLNELAIRLGTLRNNLLVKAINDKEREKAIKFSITMAGAVCQVIPYGQPALGTVGKLADVAADFVGSNPEGVPDTVSKMGDVLKAASAAAKEAKEATDEAKQEKDAPPAKDAVAKSIDWAQAGEGLGNAVSMVADAIKTLQVPQAEIDAELARLESEDPEWNTITGDIRDLNEKKVALFRDLVDALQSVGEGFARLSYNAAAVVSLQQQRNKALATLDPEAVLAVQQLAQRSRLTLQKYLYLIVKAYESTILRPLAVDWNLAAVTKKISVLLKPEKGFNAETIIAYSTVLDGLFQENLSTIRRKLLDDFDLGELRKAITLGLSAQQTPEIVAALNEKGQVVVNPQVRGLILPDEQLARLSTVELSKLTFDPSGPQLPAGTNALVSLVPARAGTMRRAEGLYVVASDSPVRWSWTYFGGEIEGATPSETAMDVLNFILGEGSDHIKQKVSLPPAWSDLRLSIQFSPEPEDALRPRVSELYLKFGINSSKAPDFQRVLTVRSIGTSGGAVIACSPDLAKRGDGVGGMVRIYNTGQTVRLSVPNHAAGAVFEGWQLRGVDAKPALDSPTVTFKMEKSVVASALWARSEGRAEAPIVLSRVIDRETLGQIAKEHASEDVRAALTFIQVPAARMPGVRTIRIDPQASAAVIGEIAPDGVPEVLEEPAGAWRLVNYKGTVGWIQ